MKIRSGFVSNSSSSSFIVSDEHFPTIKDLATYMIDKKIKDAKYEIEDLKFYAGETTSYQEYCQKEIDELNEFITENLLQIRRLENIDENQSVSFPSSNYDTYIRKIGNCYLVATCNNTNWDLWKFTTNLTDPAIIELKELKKTIDSKYIDYILEGDREFFHIGLNYYDLSYDVVGVITCDHCSIHIDEYLWETPKYGKICLTCSPYFKRKDKLNAINKIANE